MTLSNDICQLLSLDDAEIQTRREYLNLSTHDLTLLKQLNRLLDKQTQHFIDDFYAHLKQFDSLSVYFQSDAQMESLKQKQFEYFHSLTTGIYDRDYVDARIRIGIAHQKIGLEPKWYYGAYNKYLINVFHYITEIYKNDMPLIIDTFAALLKVVFLDLCLIVDTYHACKDNRLLQMDRYCEDLFRTLPVPMVLLDHELTVLNANIAAGDLLGQELQTLLHKSIHAALPDKPVLEYLAYAANNLADAQELFQGQVKLSGEFKWLHVTSKSITTDKDAIKLLVTLQDKTEAKKHEIQHADTNAFLSKLLEVSPCAIATFDTQGNILSINQSMSLLLGADMKMLVGKNLESILRGSECDIPFSFASLVKNKSPCTDMRAEITDAEGLRIPVDFRICPYLQTNSLNYILFAQDISGQLYLEKRMRHLSRALEQTADLVMITDEKGVIEYVNNAFEKTTGYTSTEAIGKTPNLLSSGMQNSNFYQQLWSTILSGDVFRNTIINRRKDGTIYYEEKTITPLRTAGGTVTHFVSTGKDITDRIKSEERLYYLAHFNPITELPNLLLFSKRLEDRLIEVKKNSQLLATLALTMDRYTDIKRSLEPTTLEAILRFITARLRLCLCDTDLAGYLDVGEFIIAIDYTTSSTVVVKLANKIKESLRQPIVVGTQDYYFTFSIGLSLYPHDSTDAIGLITRARKAMHYARDESGDQFQFYTSGILELESNRMEMESALHRAMTNQEFEIYYQPIVNTKTGAIYGMEALLRWNHPTRGILMPSEFISLLEITGLILPIGDWIFEQVCLQNKAWQTAGFNALVVSVNVSPVQLQRGDLVGTIAKVLAATKTSAPLLQIEITENSLINNNNKTIAILQSLHLMNVNIAIDDFGTGYSSLNTLKMLPLDFIKIDRCFVEGMLDNNEDRVIVETLINIGQKLNINVIAEGIETEEQLKFIDQMGCNLIQGYLFSRPVDSGDFTRILQSGKRL